MMKRSILTTALLAVGTAVLAGAPAHAGIVDGSVNNAHVLDNVGVLNAMMGSNVETIENNNANTRAQGKENNSVDMD